MAGERMLVFPCVTKSDLIAFQNLKVNGEQEYQLSSLAMFGEPDDPRFAFVAHGPVEREWFIVFDIAGNAELAAQVAAARLGGFYPTLVTGTGSHDFAKPDYYLVTVVFERLPSGEALQWAVQPSVTVFEDWEGFAETLKDTSAMVVSADSFGTVTSSGKIWNFHLEKKHLERYACVQYAQIGPRWKPWSVQLLDDVPRYDPAGVQNSAKNNAVMRNWARIDQAVPSRWKFQGANSTIVSYRKDMYEPWPKDLQDEFVQGKRVVGPVNLQELEHHLGVWVNQYGFWPHHIGANGPKDSPRYCCTFVPWGMRAPRARYLYAIDASNRAPPTYVPELSFGGTRKLGPKFTGNAGDFGIQDGFQLNPGGKKPRWAPPLVRGQPRSRADLVWRGGLPCLVSDPPLDWGPIFPAQGGGGTGSGGGTIGGQDFQQAPSEASLLAQIDQRVRLEMEWRHSRHAQLVISIDGKCKLARAYTYGEVGYLCTQLHHKMMIKSVSKWLTAMAVVKYFTDADLSISQMRQQLREWTLPALFDLTESGIGAKGEPQATYLRNTNLEHLLSRRSGWAYDFWIRGKQILNKKHSDPGDLRDTLELSTDAIWGGPPVAPGTGGVNIYNNFAFVALAEAVARHVKGSHQLFRQLMAEVWQDTPHARSDSIPQPVDQAFQRNGSPAHSFLPAWKEDWLNESQSILNQPVYYGDNDWWMGTDMFLTMPMLGRILDGYVEDAPHPVKPLLNLKQLLLMGLGPENDPTLLLGIDSSTPIQLGPTSLSRPNWGQYLRLFKNGGEDGATAFAALYRKGFGGGSGPQQIVIVFAQDGARDGIFEVSADAILAPARRMVDWGYWADERNLYDQLL